MLGTMPASPEYRPKRAFRLIDQTTIPIPTQLAELPVGSSRSAQGAGPSFWKSSVPLASIFSSIRGGWSCRRRVGPPRILGSTEVNNAVQIRPDHDSGPTGRITSGVCSHVNFNAFSHTQRANTGVEFRVS